MNKKIGKIFVAALAFAMSSSLFPAWAAPTNSSLLTIESSENPVESLLSDNDNSPAKESTSLRTIGKEEADSVKITLINNTGSAITYICIFENDPESELYKSLITDNDDYYDEDDDEDTQAVKELQKELIRQGFLNGEADGSFGPMTMAAVEAFREKNNLPAGLGADDEMLELLFADYDDGNFLEKDEVIENKEKVILSFPEAKPQEHSSQPEDTAENTDENIYPESDYLMIVGFKMIDEDGEVYDDNYILHYLPADVGSEIILSLSEDEFVYIDYSDSASGKNISTFEIEKAVFEYELTQFLEFDEMFEIDWDDEDMDDDEWIGDDEDWDDEDWIEDDEDWIEDDEDWIEDGEDWDGEDWIEDDEDWVEDDEDWDDEDWIEDDEDWDNEYYPESDPDYIG